MRIRALDSIRGLLLLQMTLDHFGRPVSFYLYPTLKTELVFWCGYNFSKQIDTDFAMGVSAKASF